MNLGNLLRVEGTAPATGGAENRRETAMNGPTHALPATDPLWSGLRQWVELDPTNGGHGDDPLDEGSFDDAAPAASFVPPPLETERPAG